MASPGALTPPLPRSEHPGSSARQRNRFHPYALLA